MVARSFLKSGVIRFHTVVMGVLALSSSVAVAGPSGAPIPPAPEFTSPDIKPTLADWITSQPIALWKKIALTDPLLKPPFAAAAPGSLKGMAAGIRAVQLDVPNRVKAVRYLGTVDCVTYPQAQDMLIATMQEDPSEEVRYEAVMALRNMLTRGCCNLDSACECPSCCNRKKIARETEAHARKGKRALIKEAKGPAKKLAKKVTKEQEDERYDCCRGCANEKVMKSLAKVAEEKDDQCCWVEPSARVRLAASEAMCLFRNYADGYNLPDEEPEPAKLKDPEKKGEADATDEMESESDESVKERPKPDSETRKPAKKSIAPRVVQNQAVAPEVKTPLPVLQRQPTPLEYPVVSGMRGRCIVALKARQVVPADPQFSSVFEERTYFFSSAEAKAAFDQNPKSYAPAYGGVDPVVWLAQHRMEDGQILREFEGQFYLFASKENWETFKSSPNRYVLKSRQSEMQTVSAEK